MSFLAINLYSYKKKVLGIEVDRSVRYRVMVWMLSFEVTLKNMVPMQCRVVGRLRDVAS